MLVGMLPTRVTGSARPAPKRRDIRRRCERLAEVSAAVGDDERQRVARRLQAGGLERQQRIAAGRDDIVERRAFDGREIWICGVERRIAGLRDIDAVDKQAERVDEQRRARLFLRAPHDVEKQALAVRRGVERNVDLRDVGVIRGRDRIENRFLLRRAALKHRLVKRVVGPGNGIGDVARRKNDAAARRQPINPAATLERARRKLPVDLLQPIHGEARDVESRIAAEQRLPQARRIKRRRHRQPGRAGLKNAMHVGPAVSSTPPMLTAFPSTSLTLPRTKNTS